MKRNVFLLFLCLAGLVTISCNRVEKKQEPDKFLKLYEVGIYENNVPVYQFRPESDQYSTIITNVPDMTVRFLNPREQFAYDIKNIPVASKAGTEFKLQYVKYTNEGEDQVTEMNAEISKIEVGMAWISCPETGMGFIVNYNM